MIFRNATSKFWGHVLSLLNVRQECFFVLSILKYIVKEVCLLRVSTVKKNMLLDILLYIYRPTCFTGQVLSFHQCQFVRPFVRQVRVFLKICTLFFSHFFHEVNFFHEPFDGARFLKKSNLCPNLGKKGQKMVFWIFFLKILSFVFPENNAKWKLFLIIDFPLQTLYLGKFLSWSYCPKCS